MVAKLAAPVALPGAVIAMHGVMAPGGCDGVSYAVGSSKL
jgi:hypothetical protein